MTEVVVHELVTVTADEAGRLETEFLNGLDQAQGAFEQIMETSAWAALGYESFAGWWEQRVVPTMRALSMRPTREIADRVLDQIHQDESTLPTTQRRTQRELGELVGVSDETVARRSGARSAPATPVAQADLDAAAGQPSGHAAGEPAAIAACESCGGKLDAQNAEVGYLRCEGCDPEGDHVASTFPRDAEGGCVACHPDDPQAQKWLATNRPPAMFPPLADESAPEPAPAAGQESRDVPPPMTEAEKREHAESVHRARDIAAAHRASESIIHDLRVAMVTIVTGCRYGETGLVTKDMVHQLREIIDQLEGEL